jgi:predicted TIM-barrel fold metal-dependent hydrolase
MSTILGEQIKILNGMGFDGLKIVEGKPTFRKICPISLDSPNYENMWTTLEELEMPVVFHVADPEEFWDAELVPSWARDNGWFYGDGTFPTKDELYAEVDNILTRHPQLKLILAHFYFLSADLPRAGRLFDTYPNICFDLTPGSEMYANFTRNYDASREFFLRYQTRIIYGSDTGSWSIAHTKSLNEPLSKAWVMRTFLETDKVFDVPDILAHWMESDLDGFHGFALPGDVLEKIYHKNFKRLYSPSPKALNNAAVKIELERMAASIDEIAGDLTRENPARQAIELF